jgi:hypothetical protein
LSLYRQASGARGRVAAIAAVVALLGAGAGFAIGRATAPEPTLTELAADARAAARPALSSLELVDLEYGQGVGSSGQDAAPTELEAAREHADAAQAAIDGAEGLGSLDPAGVERAQQELAGLRAAIDDQATADEVRSHVRGARAAIEDLTGVGG